MTVDKVVALFQEMEKKGYDKTFAAGLTAYGGMLGPIIPPSVMFVVYSVLAQVSVSDMLIAGIVPGVILTVMFCVVIALMGYVYNYPRADYQTPRQRVSAAWLATGQVDPEQFELPRVPFQAVGRKIPGPEAHAPGVERQAQPFAALGQCRLGGALSGYVGIGAEPQRDLPVGIAYRHGTGKEPAILAVLAAQREGVFPKLAAVPGVGDAFQHAIPVVGFDPAAGFQFVEEHHFRDNASPVKRWPFVDPLTDGSDNATSCCSSRSTNPPARRCLNNKCSGSRQERRHRLCTVGDAGLRPSGRHRGGDGRRRHEA